MDWLDTVNRIDWIRISNAVGRRHRVVDIAGADVSLRAFRPWVSRGVVNLPWRLCTVTRGVGLGKAVPCATLLPRCQCA